jgi:hypothetical protein
MLCVQVQVSLTDRIPQVQDLNFDFVNLQIHEASDLVHLEIVRCRLTDPC